MTTTPVRLLASRVRPEEKWVLRALRERGAAPEVLDPRSLHGCPARAHPTGTLRGRDAGVVLNREVGQVRAAYAADLLEQQGAQVVNTAEASRLCGDKWRTSTLLARAGLPTPETRLALTPEAAVEALAALGYPAVLKPLVGSWGRLVTRLDDERAATAVLEHVAALPSPQSHVVYVQRLVETARDLRVVVVDGRALGAMSREADGWRGNVARGATPVAVSLGDDLARLARDAAATVGADVAGVDVLEDRDGALTVLEVNDRVEFKGFQHAHDGLVDVAGELADLLLTRADAHAPPTTGPTSRPTRKEAS